MPPGLHAVSPLDAPVPPESHFLVVGAGGLGCPALLALCAAGARRITVFDHDRVETSNLQRQVLYTVGDVGAPKAEAAARHLRARRPALDVEPVQTRIEPDDLAPLAGRLGPGTVVLECTDAPLVKFALNDLCVATDTPLVVGAVLGWHGQVMAVAGDGPCYRCVYEAPPPAELTPNCSQAGVLGAAAGMVGATMVSHAVSLAQEGAAAPGVGRLLDIDFKATRIREISPARRDTCSAGHPRPQRSAGAAFARP